MSVDSPLRPQFTQVDADEAADLMRAANSRRDWSDVREALMGGQRLFLSEDQLTKHAAKYLALSLQRNGETRRLHVRRAQHAGVQGKLLWLGEERSEPVVR